MSMVHPASLAAYRAIPDIVQREAIVYRCLKNYPGSSANEIAEKVGKVETNVRSRLSDLQRAGRVKVVGKKTDAITGRRVQAYEVVP